MASEPFGRTLIDKIAFGAFLVLTASLAIQKPSLLIVSGLSLTATDFVFPISLVLTATAVLFRKLRIRRSTLYLLFGVYICAFVLATLFSPNNARSTVKVFATVYLVGIAVIASIVIDSEFRLKIVVLTFLAASCIPILIGLLTIVIFYVAPDNSLLPYVTYHYGAVPVGNYPRLSSTFVSASMFCNYLNVSLIFLLGAFGRNWISTECFLARPLGDSHYFNIHYLSGPRCSFSRCRNLDLVQATERGWWPKLFCCRNIDIRAISGRQLCRTEALRYRSIFLSFAVFQC